MYEDGLLLMFALRGLVGIRFLVKAVSNWHDWRSCSRFDDLLALSLRRILDWGNIIHLHHFKSLCPCIVLFSLQT